MYAKNKAEKEQQKIEAEGTVIGTVEEDVEPEEN